MKKPKAKPRYKRIGLKKLEKIMGVIYSRVYNKNGRAYSKITASVIGNMVHISNLTQDHPKGDSMTIMTAISKEDIIAIADIIKGKHEDT